MFISIFLTLVFIFFPSETDCLIILSKPVYTFPTGVGAITPDPKGFPSLANTFLPTYLCLAGHRSTKETFRSLTWMVRNDQVTREFPLSNF